MSAVGAEHQMTAMWDGQGLAVQLEYKCSLEAVIPISTGSKRQLRADARPTAQHNRLDGEFALVFAIPVMDAICANLDEDQTRRVGSLFEPAF